MSGEVITVVALGLVPHPANSLLDGGVIPLPSSSTTLSPAVTVAESTVPEPPFTL